MTVRRIELPGQRYCDGGRGEFIIFRPTPPTRFPALDCSTSKAAARDASPELIPFESEQLRLVHVEFRLMQSF